MLQHLNSVPTKPQRVVVIGAGGFVGSTTIKNLQQKHIASLGLSRNEVDLLQPNAEQILNDYIQAGDSLVILATIAPCKNAQQLIENLQMLQVICNVVKEKSNLLNHLVYISSDAVYADDVALANEESKMQPSSFHGMMHAARELMMKSVAGNIPLAILRPSILFGLHDPHNGYGPNKFFRLAQQEQNITLFGGGEEQRDHIYIDDVAQIIALTLLHRSKGVLNIATGRSYAFKDVAEQIVAITGKAVKIEPTVRQNPITHRHFDITATRQAFPNFQYTDMLTGLKQVQQQYQANLQHQGEPA